MFLFFDEAVFCFFKMLFIFRERERKDKREERNNDVERGLSHAPNGGPGLQPRHVGSIPNQGIVITYSTGPHQPGLFYDFF